MGINKQNTDISTKIDWLIIIKGVIQLASPFVLMATIMAFVFFKQNLNIVIHTSMYKPSILQIDSIFCQSTEESTSQFCDGFGYVENIYTSIDLGDDFDVDYDRKTYPVFYRQDGKLTLIRKGEDMVFDNTPYVKTALWQLGLPLIIILSLLIYYRRINKKIKRYEENKSNTNSV